MKIQVNTGALIFKKTKTSVKSVGPVGRAFTCDATRLENDLVRFTCNGVAYTAVLDGFVEVVEA